MKKLRRPKRGKKFLGVCAAFANLLEVDVSAVRLVWIVICLFPPVSTLVAIALYFLLAYLIPEEKDYIDI